MNLANENVNQLLEIIKQLEAENKILEEKIMEMNQKIEFLENCVVVSNLAN